jgi:hypothetical protein
MISWYLKQQTMAQYKLNKALLIMLVCFAGLQSVAQEVLNDVKLEKINTAQYRIRYKLNEAKDYELNVVTVKVYRRRDGQVEEIFTEAVNVPQMSLGKSQTYTYNWKPGAALIKEGDALQARVEVTYNNPLLAKKEQKSLPNTLPTANAGAFMDVQLPVTSPIVLNATKSFDSDGKIAAVNWKQIAGPTVLTIANKDAPIASVSGAFKEGRYAFELTVTDDKGASDIDRIMINVKGGDALPTPAAGTITKDKVRADTLKTNSKPANTTANAQDNKTVPKTGTNPQPAQSPVTQTNVVQQKKKDSAVVAVKKPVIAKAATPALKGGPSNVFINVLLPGVGHYKVSGDQYGNDRKPTSFIVTALYAGALGGAGYYKYRSTQEYKNYIELSKFREEQTDANGDVIGIRGANQGLATRHLKSANTYRKNALILAGIGGGILAADLVYTFIKGSRNKKLWKEDGGVGAKLFLSSDGTSLAAGLRVKI